MSDGGLEALKLFRSVSPALSDLWDEDMDAENWPTVKLKDGRVTHLKLEGTPKAPVALGDDGLPTEIGGLVHLVTLELLAVKQMTVLPPTLGKLSKLTTLALRACNDLTAIPTAIGQLSKLETLDIHSCVKLTTLPAELGSLPGLRAIKMQNCVGLETLPCEIGNLTGLKTLRAEGCIKLRELPLEFGQLVNLNTLNIEKCKQLDLPEEYKGITAKSDEVVGYLAAHLAIAARPVATPIATWLHKRPSAAAVFLNKIVTDPEKAPALAKAVTRYPSLPEVADKGGKKAMDYACAACKAKMETAMFFLGRFEVDAGPPMHCSGNTAIFAATDCEDKAKKERRCLKLMRDEQALLSELKGRLGIENGVLLPILGVYASASEVVTEESWENMYDGKVSISKVEELEIKLDDLMRARCAIGSSVLASHVGRGFKYVVVMRLCDASLASLAPMMRHDLPCVRKCVFEVTKCVDKLHAQKKMLHAGLAPRHVALVGAQWQLLDMALSCHMNKPFKRTVDTDRGPCAAYAPPEMAKVLLNATDPATAAVDLGRLKEYAKASAAYDLWSIGCMLYELLVGAPLWHTTADGGLAGGMNDLQRLANWTAEDADERLLMARGGSSEPRGGSAERLAAVDLLRKLLEPSEAGRLAHFAAATEQREAKVSELEEYLTTQTNRVIDLEQYSEGLVAQLQATSAALQSTQQVLAPAKHKLSALEPRDVAMSRERERVLGLLRGQLSTDLKEAEGMFGGAAKERIALVQSFLDAFEASLPEVQPFDPEAHASLGVVATDPKIQAVVAAVAAAPVQVAPGSGKGGATLDATPAATPAAAATAVSKKGGSGGTTSEERHLNELQAQLEAMEGKVQQLEGKERQAAASLSDRDARISELEAQLASLELKAAGEGGNEPPSAKRETTKKSKKAKDKAALPPLPPDAGIRSPKDGTAPAESQRNSARPKEKRQSMKDRMAVFNKGT